MPKEHAADCFVWDAKQKRKWPVALFQDSGAFNDSAVIDAKADADLAGVKLTYLQMTPAAYRACMHSDAIECVRNKKGKIIARTVYGLVLFVPGTALE